MGKTYKRIPFGCVRSPKGRKQALINEARKGALPPDAYDDKPFDKQCFQTYDIAYDMIKSGMEPNEVIKKLRNKYKLTHQQAMECVKSVL